MGVLAPIFLTGLAALSIPLLLHLVRRTPRGRQEFSSLMFLSPTPPRLTRRSRLDQILLLLLRLGVLGLVAFAFARPFLREAAALTVSDLAGRRVALLIDVSASLRRGDLWTQALAHAEQELQQLGPNDDVALYAFSDRVRRLVEFESESFAAPAVKAERVRQALAALRPDWGGTNLADALSAIAGEMETTGDVNQSALNPQIILISDFQSGSRFDALQSYDWPAAIRLIPRPVLPADPTNAVVQLLTSDEDAPDAVPRVRLSSARDSTSDEFQVRWETATTPPSAVGAMAVYVPPGQSRVVRLARPADAAEADRLTLRGDAAEFDNQFFVAPLRRQSLRVGYLGEDADDDARGVQYYLRLAVGVDPLRQVDVVPLDGSELSPAALPLIVVSSMPDESRQAALKTYLQGGGIVLQIPATPAAVPGLAALNDELLAEAPPEQAELPDDQYLMLGEIDFSHPLFTGLANPRYSDFTRIRFWTAWPARLRESADTRIVARFDNAAPALLERRLGEGRLLQLLTSWSPDDSQLALSNKFVPLMGGLLDLATGGGGALPATIVHQPVELPESWRAAGTTITGPDGTETALPPGTSRFEQTTLPGIYLARSGTEDGVFAVNVAPAESDTAPFDPQHLEQFGVRLGADLTQTERLDHMRQQRDTELEGRQKVWQWLILGALGLLLLEMWWADHARRRSTRTAEAVT
ncbi:MAG: BatA domain-containing protein [Planctomyces sp.]|nr:BatA domain-containing protein [Planctomyces sp.]